jgi:hypothetical protein
MAKDLGQEDVDREMNLGGALLESKGKKGNSRKRAQKKKIGGLTLGAPRIIPGASLI